MKGLSAFTGDIRRRGDVGANHWPPRDIQCTRRHKV